MLSPQRPSLIRGIECVPFKKPPEGHMACEHSKPSFSACSACTKLLLISFAITLAAPVFQFPA